MKLVTWNVNGIRAAARNGFLDWLGKHRPEIACVQETKARPEQLAREILEPPGYRTYWTSAEKPGYSGVATFTREEPRGVEDLGDPRFDREGRVQILHFADFCLVNCYFPNSQEGGARLGYKLDFCRAILHRLQALRAEGKTVVICGDFNIAHRPIDLARPEANEKNPGYLPEERSWMDEFLAAGYVDVFRQHNPGPGHYTWWSYRFQARVKNLGWRIDYHCVNAGAEHRVQDSRIQCDVLGSDHCPVLMTFV